MKERVWMRVVWALPKQLVYWCGVRLIAFATTGRYSATVVPELSAMEALERWSSQGRVTEDKGSYC